MESDVVLRDYQKEGVQHLLATPHAALLYDPGLGKTLTSLIAFETLRREGKAQRALVVAPLRVAQSVWAAEAARWNTTKHLRVHLMHGPKKHVKPSGVDLDVINYEGLKWLFAQNVWPWDLLIFDELSKMKDTSTQRHKLVRKHLDRFPRRWGLTGTPAPNSLLELFGQMRVIDGGASLGTSLERYQYTYFEKPFPQSFDWILKPGADVKIAHAISPVCHRLKAEDHLDMPPLYHIWHYLELPKKALDVYRDMENDLLTELSGGELITAMSAGVAWGKLQQIVQGFMYRPDGSYETLHSAKLDALEDIVEEASGAPVLVMFRFKADLHELQDVFPQARLLRGPDDVRDWNAGKIQVLLANPQSAGHGLNLQGGGHILVWYAIDPSLERYIQANGRLYRQGQRSPVVVHHLAASGTIDEQSREVLERRATIQSALLGRIQRVGKRSGSEMPAVRHA